MSKKGFIDSITVKNECSESWDEMRGTEKVRFCGHCDFNVHNISELTRKQAMKLVREADGRVCVRYVKNPVDNRPVFADKLYQITRRASFAAGVLGASLAFSTFAFAQGQPVLNRLKADAQTEKITKEKDETDGTASISGTITDPQGAVVPNVPVSLLNEKTGENRSAISNDEGFYKFENVAEGVYKLVFNGMIGFAPKEIQAVSVANGANTEQNVALEANLRLMTMGLIALVEYRTGLHLAVSNNNAEEVGDLITRGANVNQKDENYNNITPLFVAVENGSAEIAETLLNAGAKVNAKDGNRQTPLMRLDEDATPELVNLLIKHRAKINLTDNEGNNALMLASRTVNAEVLRILINHTANLNAQNATGRTALMEAADADSLENVRALLEAGADVNLKDSSGETALDLTNDEAIQKLLTEFGANIENNSN